MLIVAILHDPDSNQVTSCSVEARQSKKHVQKNINILRDEYLAYICLRQNLHRSAIAQLLVVKNDKVLHFFGEEDLA